MNTRNAHIYSPFQQNFDQSEMKKITRCFSMKSSRPPLSVQLPFDPPPLPTFDEYKEQIEAAITECLESESITYAVQKMFKISRALSSTNDISQVHNLISSHVIKFAETIPESISDIHDAEEIGVFWSIVKQKITIVIESFSPLCKPQKNLEKFDSIFYKALYQVYSEHIDLYESASQLIIKAYDEAHETDSSEKLKEQFSFLTSTDLFETHFLPLLIKSVITYITPKIQEALNKGIVDYLLTAQEISEKEEKLAKPLLTSPTALRKLTSAVNTTVFTDNLVTFVATHLNELVSQTDSNSISICAHLSNVTNTASIFTDQLADVFQKEVANAYNLPDPFSKILELYNSFSSFVSAAFGTNSARILKEGFEKGLKVDDEKTAKMLEVAIHNDFPKGVDIDPYVGIFTMLRIKDIFQSYHTLYLNRRALECTPEELEDDRKFAEKLKESCGAKYTEPMFQTFDDYDQSIQITESFFESYKDQYGPMRNIFTPFFFSHDSWENIDLKPVKVPRNIQDIMTCFEQFTERETKGKKLKWSMQLSKVDLKATGFDGIQSVTCNAIVAVVLLAMSDGAKTIEEIMNKTLLEEKEVNNVLTKMSSKKTGKIIDRTNMTLNKAASIAGGIVDVFSIVTQTEATSAAAPEVHDSKIDAAVLKILKSEQSMDKEELFREVDSFLARFKITREEFETQLPRLELRGLIKIDPSGKVHYKST